MNPALLIITQMAKMMFETVYVLKNACKCFVTMINKQTEILLNNPYDETDME